MIWFNNILHIHSELLSFSERCVHVGLQWCIPGSCRSFYIYICTQFSITVFITIKIISLTGWKTATGYSHCSNTIILYTTEIVLTTNLVCIGVNPGEIGGRDPPDFGQGGSWWGVVGGRRGESRTGRKILFYLIMYRKYVRKWWLLKRNRIIWPEIAVNSQFLPGTTKFSLKSPKKSKFFENLPL